MGDRGLENEFTKETVMYNLYIGGGIHIAWIPRFRGK